jgi:hypothetical protein
MIETRRKRKEKITKKIKNFTQKKDAKKNDLKEPNEMIHIFLMSFTIVFTQLDKRGERSGLIPSSQ